MLWPQTKKKLNAVIKIFGFFLVVFIVTGCVSPQNKTVKKAEKAQAGSKISDASVISPEKRQIRSVSIELEKSFVTSTTFASIMI